ncbi:molybdenum ABC transporter ATP-binding protein [Pikeienuella sp. HZG-20]|uniref:molybdenum ABC transporter ATP-binding protein n=1 Tax=Paludibacillus litoralis TaxID=3133267 RepID=UPI0030EF5C6C
MALSLDIRLAYPGFDLDFQAEIAGRGLTALFGPSGCGKTTVLRTLAGLEPNAAGRVSYNGEIWQDAKTFLPPHRRGVGYVFQDARLFPHLTVAGNLAYAERRARRAGRRPAYDQVVAALALAPLLARRPGGLSGGERQRVAIGRALLTAPRILLLDEPMAALDEGRKEEVTPYIEALRETATTPILLVSHSLTEVARLASDIVVMREGRALRAGPLDELLADPGFAPVIGPSMAGAVLTGRVVAHHDDGLSELALGPARVFLPGVAAPVGATLRFRIRADDVILAVGPVSKLSALNILPAVVEDVHLGGGPGAMIALRVGDQRLLARVTRRSLNALGLAPGAPCSAVVKSVAVMRAEIGPG